MPTKKSRLPLVSFLLPTYNAEAYLRKCLGSIFALDYPKELLEVIVADGGSIDSTREIASRLKCKVIDNPKKTAEFGKLEAFRASKGEYLVLIDSDNIIATKDWLKKLLKVLEADSEIFGAESNYLIAKDFTSLNAYLNLLVIVDPLSRMMASRPTIEDKDSFLVKTYEAGAKPVSGANGFIWRSAEVQRLLIGQNELNEVGLLSKAARNQVIKIGNVPGIGIYHYYSSTIFDYIKKRRKIARIYFSRRRYEEGWIEERGTLRLFLSAIYLATIIGPLVEGIKNTMQTRKLEWMWHPVICFISFVVNFVYWFTFKSKRHH
jgi:glycosyltransferase involved in cell wall biosynthesis